jgi:hypothetical protein
MLALSGSTLSLASSSTVLSSSLGGPSVSDVVLQLCCDSSGNSFRFESVNLSRLLLSNLPCLLDLAMQWVDVCTCLVEVARTTGITSIELSERNGKCAQVVGIVRSCDLCMMRCSMDEVLCMRVEGAKCAGELGEQVDNPRRRLQLPRETCYSGVPRSVSIPGALDMRYILGNAPLDDG